MKLDKRTYVLLLLLALTVIPAAGGSGAVVSSDEAGIGKNQLCLACHGSQGGVEEKYFIDQTRFGHSTHAQVGCVTCHSEITASHPDGRHLTRSTQCADCHASVEAEYAGSPHANNAACNGCHNPHQVYTPEETSGDLMNKQCTAACHATYRIEASHSRWLPQAGLHLTAVPCITCHSQAENYVVSIYIIHKNGSDPEQRLEPASYTELRKLAGRDDLQPLIDKNQDHYISLTELRMFNSNPAYRHLLLKGMLIPVKPTHSFRTFDNRWDCTSCHVKGPEAMETSYLALPAADGTYAHVAVEKGAVLDALQAVPNFYMTAGTRSAALNGIGLLILVGGMVMPVGHGLMRFLTRKNRRGKE